MEHARHPSTIAKSKRLIQIIRRYPNVRTVLDFGCGSGALVNMLCENYSAYGYDNSDENIGVARELHGGCYLTLINNSLQNSFDMVILSHVLEHFAKADEIMPQVLKVLKHGGYLLVSVPNKKAMKNRFWHNEIRRNVYDSDHREYYTPNYLRSTLTEYGLKELLTETYTYPYEAILLTLQSIYRNMTRNTAASETSPVANKTARNMAANMAYSRIGTLLGMIPARLSQTGEHGTEINSLWKKHE